MSFESFLKMKHPQGLWKLKENNQKPYNKSIHLEIIQLKKF